MAEDFCRLCLRPVDKANCAEIKKDEAKQEMFSEFFPELNIDLSANPTLCNECALNLEVSSNFKQGVLENEARIESELAKSKSKAKKKKIDLKTLLDAETKNELKSDLSICRTCLAICKDPSIRLYEAKTNVMPYSFVKKMCVQIFELEFTNSDKPVMCDECWETLQNAYDFRKNCLKTEKKITSYCQENKLTILGEIDLKKLNSLPANEDDSEMSDDDDFGDVDIKEEIFDPNDPDLSNPGSSSSLQHVKLKKEEDGASGSVSVKSESGMDDEDEDMGDHPDLVDPNNLKSEEDGEGDDIDTKMEVGDTVKVDPEAAGAAGPSGCKQENEVSPRTESSSVYQQKGSTLSCERCLYQTQFSSKLKRHLLVHATQKTGELPVFKCSECHHMTMWKQNLKKHMRIHNAPNAVPNAVPPFECNKCTYTTNRKYYLKLHMLVHAEPNEAETFECDMCQYKTKRKSSLQVHKLIHAEPKQTQVYDYECNMCSYKTNKKRNLKLHMLLHAEPKFQCNECQYKTKRRSDLRKHMQKHAAPDAVPRFECDKCTYRTNIKYCLKLHMIIHAEPNEVQVFECNECQYKTKRKSNLKVHMVRHTAPNTTPRFECSKCWYKTRRKSQLNRHIKQVHDLSAPAFECNICAFKTKSNDSLKVHIMRMHSVSDSRRTFECNECMYKTKQMCHLKSHIRRMHSAV